MDGISRSRGWDKEIPHGVLPMEQLVLSDKWARNVHLYSGITTNYWNIHSSSKQYHCLYTAVTWLGYVHLYSGITTNYWNIHSSR